MQPSAVEFLLCWAGSWGGCECVGGLGAVDFLCSYLVLLNFLEHFFIYDLRLYDLSIISRDIKCLFKEYFSTVSL